MTILKTDENVFNGDTKIIDVAKMFIELRDIYQETFHLILKNVIGIGWIRAKFLILTKEQYQNLIAFYLSNISAYRNKPRNSSDDFIRPIDRVTFTN